MFDIILIFAALYIYYFLLKNKGILSERNLARICVNRKHKTFYRNYLQWGKKYVELVDDCLLYLLTFTFLFHDKLR